MRIGRAGVVLVVAMSSLSTVHAEPTAADRETARGLMADGRDKREKGDLTGALTSFRAAHQLMGVPTTGLEVGKTEAALGMLVEARDTLLTVARMPAKPGEPAPFASARAEADQLAESIAPRIPTVKLVLTGVAVHGAPKLTIDGADAPGIAPELPRKMNPGSHTIAVRTDDAEGKTTFQLAEGETRSVSITLVASAAPAKKPDAVPQPASHTLAWIGFGVAGAGLVVGSVTGLMHFSQTNDLESRCPDHRCGPETAADYDAASRTATISTISFVVAGVGAAVGVYDLLRPRASETKTARVRLTVGLGRIGLGGSF